MPPTSRPKGVPPDIQGLGVGAMSRPPPRRRPNRRRVLAPAPRPDGGLGTKLALFGYALSRLPPRQLPLLALYASAVIHLSSTGWFPREAVGKAGVAVVGVLSMVTGLLLSYRFSSAMSTWDEGKKVWVDVRTNIRDGIRLLSVKGRSAAHPSPSIASSTPIDLGEDIPSPTRASDADEPGTEDDDAGETPIAAETSRLGPSSSMSSQASSWGSPQKPNGGTAQSTPWLKKGKGRDDIAQRVDELSGLLVGFAFALQHHLHGTRPLPQPPLCDLLPLLYLSSLKRTEARVRFAETHAGPSGSTSLGLSDSPASTSDLTTEGPRPVLRRRSTGPPTKEEREAAGEGEEEWELQSLRDRAEEAVAKLAEAVAGSGGSGEGYGDTELRQQLSQLNLPSRDRTSGGEQTPPIELTPTKPGRRTGTGQGNGLATVKSNLYSPYPANLPLALLKLMEAYAIGLAEISPDKGGWTEAKRERALGIVKALGANLGEAERLCANPPPLPLTIHLSHLLLIYLAALPCSLLCVVTSWPLVLITLIAGWCLLGLEALIGEVGGVFGHSENHHPLPRFSRQILVESLEASPAFARFYRARLVARVGEDDAEVVELDRRWRRAGGEEWMPTFT